jgi:hypothetical protein
MVKPPPNVLELPLGERAFMALKAAIENVTEEHAREGLPLHIWRDGQVVAVPAEESSARNPEVTTESISKAEREPRTGSLAN